MNLSKPSCPTQGRVLLRDGNSWSKPPQGDGSMVRPFIGTRFKLGGKVKTLPCPFPLADDLGIDNNLRIKFADCLCLKF